MLVDAHSGPVPRRTVHMLITSLLLITAIAPTTRASSPDPTYFAWGYNHVGQLGLGNTTSTTTPTPGFGPRFIQIVAGIRFACGLTPGGAAYCWGENTAGQLGSGDTNPHTEPQPVTGGHTFVSLTAGAAHACGVTPTDSIFCWGSNADGQLGVGDTTDRLVPSLVPNSYSQVAAGIANTCALTRSGRASCWGTGDYFGEPAAIGDGTLNSSNLPVQVTMPAGRTFVSVGVGWYSACALDDLGQAWCWGINAQGQLGTGDTTGRLIPTAVVGGVTFSSLSVGGSHRCGIASAGSTYCWGDNTNGQLASGTTVNQLSPEAVTGGQIFESVVAYSSYSCALTGNGTAYCWGENREGQLGLGTRGSTPETTPQVVVGNQRFSRLAEGSRAGQFTFALPLQSATGNQVPTAPMQQFGRAESDECGVQPENLVDFPALGDRAKDVGWGPSWAQWPNGGTGGFVCTRQPYYTSTDTWAVR